jgi:nitrate reductase / nitrite oxidoreductase, alpha subunit
MPSQLRHVPQFFKKGVPNAEGWSELVARDRDWEDAYRRRWQFDKIVRSTHGVNCTGSCSWKIYVKDGIVTWETQQTDYPTNGPERPEYEPRGCQRGASASWYLYSPHRIRYPYVRGTLWHLWQMALRTHPNDPVAAWRSIVEDPKSVLECRRARGKGGFVRARAPDVYQMISAALVHTIQKHGPDRVLGFSPIPAMSMASYASGSRFLSLLGGVMLSFYDWYCDLPPASPQVWGEQTDVPEGADWYNSAYLMMWGSNVPMTRTPDAHFMTEARYRGVKTVAVSPDFTDNVKFADEWLPIRPGTDGALALGMTYVILKEFYVDREVPYFTDYARTYTDLPCLVMLRAEGEEFVGDRFLRASDLGIAETQAEWKTLVWDETTGAPKIPNGSVGFRWGTDGRWNLDLGQGPEAIRPQLTFLGKSDRTLPVKCLDFQGLGAQPHSRAVPARSLKVGDREIWVTTVLDLLLAQMGVGRGLPGDYPHDYDDPRFCTPAWQESITGVDRSSCIRVAREFAENAIISKGRSMIIMGAGINHWYHNDTIYRAILNLVILTGCQGKNGGGWAHYVGQEKIRPLEGFTNLAFGLDWMRPPRQQNATSFFYFTTDQWRYEQFNAGDLTVPWDHRFKEKHFADVNVLAARLGWLPSYPQFNRNPLDLVREAEHNGAKTPEEIADRVVERVRQRDVRFAIEDPDDPVNFPRVLFVWRGNLLSASGKGHEYFLKHLLGTTHGVLEEESPNHPQDVVWNTAAPEGKLDLLVTVDFRMAGTPLYSDVVLPAAVWYEKHDIASTDLHPFLHTFNPAVAPSYESKSDWDTFRSLAESFSELAAKSFPGPVRDLVAAPLMHDTPDEIAQPFGKVLDWSRGECAPIPGKTFPKLLVVERDFSKVGEEYSALGPLVPQKGTSCKGLSWPNQDDYEYLQRTLGTVETGIAAGCPVIREAKQACETILTLSGSTNGKVAVRSWRTLEKKTGQYLTEVAMGRDDERFRFDDLTAQPRRVISAPVWSGLETGGRQYSAFCTNVEYRIPWRTLTGRQQFYVDHELMLAYGEGLPVYRPPLESAPFQSAENDPTNGEGLSVQARWITPHSKWSIHSTFSDNLRMLTLSRGGPSVWLNKNDAAKAGIVDNDWIEVYNRNGALTARAAVSHRVQPGMALMYHAQDRTVNVPGSPLTKERGGVHNSVTRIQVKPTQMIGGYAQLSYGFNYYGPTGNQRDTYVTVRKLPEVNWLED